LVTDGVACGDGWARISEWYTLRIFRSEGNYEQHGTPKIWLYRCAEEPVLKLTDPKRAEKIAQFDRVDAFFKQFQDEEGRYLAGVNVYNTHPNFKVLFKAQLETYLRHIRNQPKPTTLPPPTKPKIDVPYRGLRALRAEDVAIFFGRTSESLDILARADNKRFVPIIGASGSGKSSLVMAGVLPELAKRGWKIIQCVPNTHPFDELALALVRLPEFNIPTTRYIPEAEALATILRDKPENLVKQLHAVLLNQKIVLYIDQFEELFTIAEKADKSQIVPFIEAIRHQAHDITTIITMRADFYETALAYLDELKEETYGLKKPSSFALYEMITRPAHDAGYVLDDRLAESIITELGLDSGALALMAYVMQTLYLTAQKRGDTHITYADYEALGGVKGAMNTLAQKAYADLPFADKEGVLRNVFFHLIALTPDENGQLVPTRGRYPIANFDANSPERVLIDRFADARLLVKHEQMVEVAHEAILRHWDELSGWIDENKVSIATYRRFERDAKEWRNNKFPLPSHDQIAPFYNALNTLDLRWEDLEEPLKTYTEPETNRLLRELDDTNTSHQRRAFIGERLATLGDPRKGIGVLDNGIPDIIWCFVNEEQEIRRRGEIFQVRPFYVAKYLITHAQYEVFLNADDGYNNPKWWVKFPNKANKPFYRRKRFSKFSPQPNLPRTNVSWYECTAFTQWLDFKYHQFNLFEKLLNLSSDKWQIRLPNEYEWITIAEGKRNLYRGYDEVDTDSLANIPVGDITQRISAVGMYPHGIVECGALDIYGNVYEWFNNIQETPNNPEDKRLEALRTSVRLMGGSYQSEMDKPGRPLMRSRDIGFRVAICPII